ncbi:MAG: hypothetical protein CTY15_01760 [Methylocystis sp.]|nr:MAG: hypothetical protein CTY15_01760 [Methylocystis sp.]
MGNFQQNLKLGVAVAALTAVAGIAHAQESKVELPKADAQARADGKAADAKVSKTKAGDAKPADGKQADGKAAGGKPEEKKSYFVPTRGYRLEPQSDVPPYVRDIGKTYKQFEGIDWLNIGLDSRARFEYRQNDYRPWTDTTTNPPTSSRRYFPNSPWLLRTRAYFGVKEIFDPFRFVVEFQDSRAFNTIYEFQGQEINHTEMIQGFGELYFKNAFGKDDLGNDRPLSVRAGRFHLELLDRRLIANNEFRNTTNNFEGFRLKIGKKENDWDIDSFLMRPVVRNPYDWDRPEWGNWVYGSVLSIRRWSEYATIQPYFLGRKQYGDVLNASNALKVHKETYSPGVRAYGVIGNWDYDVDINKQFGEQGEFRGLGNRQNVLQATVQQDAIAYSVEAGYTFKDHPWKPRISASYIYASGNKSPFDSVNQTFDQFYGFNQPFSRNDYFAWTNMKTPRVRLEFEPAKNLQVDTAFNAFWLASSAAPWERANLSAPLGNRGDFIGTEFDLRIRYKLSQFINLSASYARFWPGSFTSSFAPPVAQQPFFPQSFPGQTGTTFGLTGRPTDFFYLEASLNAFGDGQPITKDPASQLWGAIGPEAKEEKAPSWRDVYVGLNGGGAWSSPVTRSVVYPIDNAPASAPVAAASNFRDNGRSNLAGFVGGFQIGTNWKFDNNIVAGLETDLRAISGNTDGQWQSSAVPVGGNAFVNYQQRNTTLNYLGTLRGRLGYLVAPTVQVYGSGGMAYGGVTSTSAFLTRRAAGTNLTNGTAVFQDSRIGWTAGGGVEWAFMKNWSAKAEYFRYDLGSVSAFTAVAQPNGFYAYAANTKTNFDGNLIQAGVNRHFDLLEKE